MTTDYQKMIQLQEEARKSAMEAEKVKKAAQDAADAAAKAQSDAQAKAQADANAKAAAELRILHQQEEIAKARNEQEVVKEIQQAITVAEAPIPLPEQTKPQELIIPVPQARKEEPPSAPPQKLVIPKEEFHQIERTGELLSAEPTTNPDKFIVRVQIPGKPDGEYVQTYLTRQEIIDRGGEVPVTGQYWGKGAGLKWSMADAVTEQKITKAYEDLGLEPPDFTKAPRDIEGLDNDGLAGFNDPLTSEAMYKHPSQISSAQVAADYAKTITDPKAKEAYLSAFKAYWGTTPEKVVTTLPGEKERAVAVLQFQKIDDPALQGVIKRYKENPNDGEFNLKEAGGSLTLEEKQAIAFLAGKPLNVQQEMTKVYIRVGSDVPIGNFQKQVIEEYAKEHNITWNEAVTRIDAMRGDPESGVRTPYQEAELKKLSEADKKALSDTLSRVDSGADYISKREAEALKKESPNLYNTLSSKGFDAYQKESENINKGTIARNEAAKKDFETALADQPQELQDAYKEGGIDGYTKAVQLARQNSLLKISKVDAYVPPKNPENWTENDIENMFQQGLSPHELADAGVDIGKIKNVVGKITLIFQQETLPQLPENIRRDYAQGLKTGDMLKFLASYTQYTIQQQEKIEKYNESIAILDAGRYRTTREEYPQGGAPFESYTTEGAYSYDISKYLIDTKTPDNKVNPESLKILAAIYTPEDVKKLAEEAQSNLDVQKARIDFIDNAVAQRSLGFANELALDEAMEVAGINRKEKSESPIGFNLIGTETEVSSRYIWPKLTEDQKDEVAVAFENIPGRDSPLAMAINEYNKILSEIPGGKYLPITTTLLIPPVGVPLMAAEFVANVVAPYTISNDAIKKQINNNADYFNNADRLTSAESQSLRDAMANNGFSVKGDPLGAFKAFSDEDKQTVMTDLTREQLGLSPSTMDKVMAGAMVAASVLPYLNLKAIIGKWGSFAVHAPITGLFIASSVQTIRNPQATLEDKVISGLFAVLMARGMIKGLTTPKGADRQAILRKMAETLNKPSTPGISVQARVQELARNITEGIVEAKDKGNKIIDQIDNIDIDIEKITQDAIAKGKYALGGAKIQAEKYAKTISKLADNIQRKVAQLQTTAGSITASDVAKIIKAEIAKGKYALRGMEIKGGKYTEAFNNGTRALQRKLAQLQTKAGNIEASDIQRIIENTLGKTRYNIEDIAKTKTVEIQRLVENIKQSVQREITLLQIKSGNISLVDVEKIINDTIANGQYKLGGVKIKAAELEKIAQDIRQSVVSKVAQLQTKARSISASDVEKVITDALASGKYKLGDAKIKIEELSREIKDIAAEVERKINRIKTKAGNISSEDIEKIISNTINKSKYHLGGIKLTGEAAIKGVKEALEAQKGISPQELKKILNDLEKAIKSGNADAVKKAGENISNIAKQSPNEKAGEALGKQGRVIRDKAAEIVKEAEKRLYSKDFPDIEDALKETGEFIESPGQKVIEEYKRIHEPVIRDIENDIAQIKKEIRSNQSLLDNLQTQEEMQTKKPPERVKPKMSRAEVELAKVKLMSEISRDNVNLANLNGRPEYGADIQRLSERIRNNQVKLKELNDMYRDTQKIDTAKLKKVCEDNLVKLKEELRALQYELSGRIGKTTKEELWGKQITGKEPPKEFRGDTREIKPGEPPGGGKGTKVKTEVKPKTAKELEKELLPKEKAPETKPKTKPKEATPDAKPKEKAPSKTSTGTGEPVTLPRIRSGGYYAVVWENGKIFVKWMENTPLQEGYIGEATRLGQSTAAAERLRELLRTGMSPEKAAEIMAREFPGQSNYPLYYQSPTPQKQGAYPKVETQPQPEALKQPVKAPVEAPVKEVTPSPESLTSPLPSPIPKPVPEPEPLPEKIKTPPPPPTKVKVTERERNRRHNEPTTKDKDKRALIRDAHSAVTYKRGELRGNGVWHTWLKKTASSDWERAIVLGAKPEGAIYATGPGSATKTMQRLSGGSRININEDTGAVDTVLHGGEGEKVQIRFVPDKSTKHEYKVKERQHTMAIRGMRKAKEVYLGAGVVQEGLSGRRHIKIKGVRR